MQTSNVEPRREWGKPRPPLWSGVDELGDHCLSCDAPVDAGELFCRPCRRWSRQRELTSWDDLGVGD